MKTAMKQVQAHFDRIEQALFEAGFSTPGQIEENPARICIDARYGFDYGDLVLTYKSGWLCQFNPKHGPALTEALQKAGYEVKLSLRPIPWISITYPKP